MLSSERKVRQDNFQTPFLSHGLRNPAFRDPPAKRKFLAIRFG